MNICPNHQEYQVPLIWTFAFNGAELWCPYCNYQAGMLGETAESDPKNDAKLQARHDLYEKATEDYRGAHSTLVCSRLEWPRGSGKWIDRSELPAEEVTRCREVAAHGWKFNVKAEALSQ